MPETVTIVQHLIEKGSENRIVWQRYGVWAEDKLSEAEAEFNRLGSLGPVRLSRQEVTTTTTICAES